MQLMLTCCLLTVSFMQVKPTLARLKTTLLATGGGLLLSGVLLVGSIAAGRDADGFYGMPALRLHANHIVAGPLCMPMATTVYGSKIDG